MYILLKIDYNRTNNKNMPKNSSQIRKQLSVRSVINPGVSDEDIGNEQVIAFLFV